MKNECNLIVNKKSPQIKLQLPRTMLKDLVKISNESGTSIEFQIIICLARSIERSNEMKKQDDELLTNAFKKRESMLKNSSKKNRK